MENEEKSEQAGRMANQRLYSPSLKKIMQRKDASVMLKDEIGESTLRLKAAKFGHTIDEIAPSYGNTFYLPDKEQYKSPNTNARLIRKPTSVFQTNLKEHPPIVSSSVQMTRNRPQHLQSESDY